jgi:hypothetical protein
VRARISFATATAALVVLGAALVSSASAARSLTTGIDDGLYRADNADARARAFARTVESRSRLVRIDVIWREIATGQPANPGDPGDPAYNFASIDRAVQAANANGLDVMLTVLSAPDYAEGPNRGDAQPGVFKPNPAAFADFGRALATRYSGAYAGLPRVRYYEAWNEPNLPIFLYPQWDGKRAAGPAHYRAMLNAFYAAVKDVHRTNLVIAGAMAPYGAPRNDPSQRMRPVTFLRALLCIKPNLKRAHCPHKAAFDIFSHHPIDTSGGPKTSARSHLDAATPDLHRLVDVLRAAEREHTIRGGKRRHPVWATELWWESDPPKQGAPSLEQQARYLQQGLYLLWKQGAKVVINLFVLDPRSVHGAKSGLLFADGSPKPSFTAWRFPFVTDRKSKRELIAWGKAPADGRLTIERRRGEEWEAVKSLDVRAGKVFRTVLSLRGQQSLRATVGGEQSLIWEQGSGGGASRAARGAAGCRPGPDARTEAFGIDGGLLWRSQLENVGAAARSGCSP